MAKPGRPPTLPTIPGSTVSDSMDLFLTVLVLSEGLSLFRQHVGADVFDVGMITSDMAIEVVHTVVPLVVAVNLAAVIGNKSPQQLSIRRALAFREFAPLPLSYDEWELVGMYVKTNAWKQLSSTVSRAALVAMLNQTLGIVTFADKGLTVEHRAAVFIDEDGNPYVEDCPCPVVKLKLLSKDLI